MVFDAKDKQCFDLNCRYLEWQCKEVYFKTFSHVLEFIMYKCFALWVSSVYM